MEGYGYPQLTDEVTQQVLGQNAAQLWGSQDGVLYDAGCPIPSSSGITHVIPETGARATACLRLNNGFSSREGDML